LLDNGANIHAIGERGRTPLHYAVSGLGGGLITELYLKNGANVNAKDNEGNTPLHRAVSGISGVTKSNVQLLIEYGADLSLKNSAEMTPLELAKKYGYDEIINMLEGTVK